MDFIVPVLVTILIIVVLILLAGAIRIVPEFQRMVVFRLGRCVGPRGPGVVFLYPFLDTAIRVDLREQVREIPAQTSITKDNAPISIDFLWYYRVFDPVESMLQVSNFELAAQGIATTTLRSVIAASCWMACCPSASRSTTPCAQDWMKLQSAGGLK